MTNANPYPAYPPKRSGFSERCSPCLVITLVAVVTSAALAFLGIVACASLPQLAAGAATALSSTPTLSPTPALDLCALLIPLGARQASNAPATIPYVISEGEEVYLLYPLHLCYASFANEELKVHIEQHSASLNAQRVEKYFQTCPQASGLHKQYTCAAIALGDGGIESEGSSDPECGTVPIVHRLMWTRGCYLVSAKIGVYERAPTPEEVQQVWDLARQVDAQLQTLPACP